MRNLFLKYLGNRPVNVFSTQRVGHDDNLAAEMMMAEVMDPAPLQVQQTGFKDGRIWSKGIT